MNFNPDTTKQAQEVIFSLKKEVRFCHLLLFINANITRTSSQKHLKILRDTHSKFEDHLKLVLEK